MKKMSYLVITFLIYFSFLLHPNALTKIIVNGTDVRFRSKPTTESSQIGIFNPGMKLNYMETASKGSGCNAPWFKGSYNGQIGYICSEFAELIEEEEINVDDYPEYKDYLVKLGFPETYLKSLVELHKNHPNWQFDPMQVNLEFNKLVQLEHDGHSQGWSLIEDSNHYIDGYKATDSWAYNYKTNVFNNSYSGGGARWYAANKATIGYYLDPRNFLNEQKIFMFEILSYNEKYHTREGIDAMLKGTFMENAIADQESKKTYTDAFIDAAVENNISPYVLIGRVIQEVGAQGSTIVSGTVPGYEGYYNFYNIGATGSIDSIIVNGLKYAKSKGWNTPYKAIIGGANFLNQGYISQGQDTLYLQKWDLIPPNYASHQYMQNIQAPSSETNKTYQGYNKLNLIDSSFTFKIPVFKSMPEKTSLPNAGNPNNYLYSLSVNGNYLFKKPTDKTTFDLNLSEGSQSIDISATKVAATSSISGTGSISLSKAKEEIPIKVTAANGDTRIYTINITRNGNIAIDISEILRTLNIKNDGSHIFGYELKTDISTIIKQIKEKEPKAIVSGFDKEGLEKNNGIIASGDKINISTGREEKNYSIVIYGDANGDGNITSADYIAIKNHIMDVKKLSAEEKIWADANKDNKVSSADYIAIKNHIMDVQKIKQ